MKYQLLVDCSFVGDKRFFPLSQILYAGRLIRGLKASGRFEVCLLIPKGHETQFDEYAGADADRIVVDSDVIGLKRLLIRVLGLIPFRKELDKRKIDAVLVPYHFESIYQFPARYNQHDIVQDLIPYHYLKGVLGPVRYPVWCLLRRLSIRKIRHFISISEKTKQELKQFEGKDSVVVYNSLPFDAATGEKPVADVPARYILDVNRFIKYKNAEVLIRALALLRDDIPHSLYLKGDSNHGEDLAYLQDLAAQLGLADRVVFDKTIRSREEMNWLYTHADLFVSPSLHEGFGWTPIEAAVLGVPVLVSDIDVLREVTKGRIDTFDPYSPEDCAAHILEKLSKPADAVSLQALSQFYLNEYSLEKQIESLSSILIGNIHV